MSGTINTAPTSSFNVGNDVRLVYMGAYGRVDFSYVTNFTAKPLTKKVTVSPLGNSPLMRYLPGGWSFTFQIERANLNADALQALKDLNFWNGGAIPLETLYQYITETDGTTSTWQYISCCSELNDAGSWQQEAAVKQTIEGFASQRIQVS
jgi:hypothetical protein